MAECAYEPGVEDYLKKAGIEYFVGDSHAILYGDPSGYWIDTLCVQTGCMRLDVSGQIDLSHFDNVKKLVDMDGVEYDPDDFWVE